MGKKEKIPFFNRIPLTRIKLHIALLLYFLVKLIIRDDNRVICRNGIRYKIDLSEGIDFSLFLFASYQRHITQSSLFSLEKDAVFFDVGANIGSMTLRFAQIAPDGHVYAFEPTSYAFTKLRRNLSLNPTLSNHISPIQVFISDQCVNQSQLQAYSSWKINGSFVEGQHPLHGGTLKSGSENEIIPAITLDSFCNEVKLDRLDCLKIDTDGHELKVLRGATQTLKKYRPIIIFEIGLYIIREQSLEFRDYYEFLTRHGYVLYNSKNNHIVDMGNFTRQIPLYYTTDLVAIYSEKH